MCYRPGGVSVRPEHPGVTGAMGPSTSWDPWPRPVTREAVGTQECTQIGGNGLLAPFWGICVHCCDSRGSRTSGAAARLASLPKQQPTQTPEEPPIETGQQVSGPIGARFGRFRLVGRLWCVERCARLTKRAVPDDLHDLLAQDVPSPHESEAHYRRDVAEHVELDELPEPPMALGPIPEGYASSPSLRGASRRQRLGSD